MPAGLLYHMHGILAYALKFGGLAKTIRFGHTVP